MAIRYADSILFLKYLINYIKSIYYYTINHDDDAKWFRAMWCFYFHFSFPISSCRAILVDFVRMSLFLLLGERVLGTRWWRLVDRTRTLEPLNHPIIYTGSSFKRPPADTNSLRVCDLDWLMGEQIWDIFHPVTEQYPMATGVAARVVSACLSVILRDVWESGRLC